MNNEIEYYTTKNIDKTEAHYRVIFGERSNGKSFSVEEIGIDDFIDNGYQMAIIRRTDVDFESRQANNTFTHFVKNTKRGNIIENKTHGVWNDIMYWRGAWYFSKFDENSRRIRAAEPFCIGFALSMCEHYKSTSYPKIRTVLFDEFITRKNYLPDEFILFQNILSTIIRDRDDVVVYMCGNTVNMYNPYFKEMGLDNANKMNPGDIQVYEFATTVKNRILKVAVEYSDLPSKNGKPSDVYFAFNNPKLKMITNGLWELALYPHLPYKYKYTDIVGIYFIKWEDKLLQCEIVQIEVPKKNNKKPTEPIYFTYVHEKTSPIRDEFESIVFSTEYDPRLNWRRKITKPMDTIGKKIKFFFDNDKVYYQSNEIGEVVRNYLEWCKTDRGIQ